VKGIIRAQSVQAQKVVFSVEFWTNVGNLAKLPARCMHYLPHTFRILPHYLTKWKTMTKRVDLYKVY